MFRAFGWAASSQFGRHAMQLGSLILLARLLEPQDFGVMSLATIVTGFVTLFRDMGTGSALIQRPVADAPLIGSVFALNALLGAAGGLLTAAAAPFIAAFFEAPVLEPVLQVLAVSLAIAGLGVVPQAVMERAGRFYQLASIELAGMAIGVITGIAMAYGGWGIWSLVGQTVVNAVITTALLVLLSGARPALPDWRLLRGIASYSVNLSGFHIFNYFVRNADNFIIGKLLGSRELGYYALAYQLAIGPIRSIAAVVSRVLFPSLARLQHDLPALRREFLKALRMLLHVCFPVMTLLVALADIGTRVVLGESWVPMVPILMVLGCVGFLQSVVITVGAIYMTTGRTDLMMRWGLITGAGAIVAFWIGAQWGPVGVAVAYAVFAVAFFYPALRIPFRLVGLRISDVWRIAAHPAAGSVLAGLISWSIARGMEPAFAAAIALVCAGGAGALFYVLWCTVDVPRRAIAIRLP